MKDEEIVLSDIERNRLEYQSFSEEYVRRGFCEVSGGYWVSHIDHIFDKFRGKYEVKVSELLYTQGNKVILLKEKDGIDKKHPDGILNGNLFEIKSIEGIGKNNIKMQFEKSFRKNVAHIVLYYPIPELFTEYRLKKGYQQFLGLKIGDFANIWYVLEDQIFIMK